MNICFFNVAHIGDNFFSQPFILNICKNNPEVTFYYWSLVGDIFFDNKDDNRDNIGASVSYKLPSENLPHLQGLMDDLTTIAKHETRCNKAKGGSKKRRTSKRHTKRHTKRHKRNNKKRYTKKRR